MQSEAMHRLLRPDLPRAALRWIFRRWERVTRWPPVGAIQFGSLRRVKPIGRRFGFDRGNAIDRYYIETFLSRYSDDVRGDVLEIGDNSYTRKFGAGRVSRSEVLHLTSGNRNATLVGDLANAQHISSDSFDCIIFTQTLQFIYDCRAALAHLHRILKPGGTLLATVPGISQISRYDMDRWGEFWRFTSLSAQRLFQENFSAANVTVQTYGNVLAAIAFLEGIAEKELTREELDCVDADYEMLISVRAVKNRSAV